MQILLNGIRLYGHHGVGTDEQQVGSWYEIDLTIEACVTSAALDHDDLSGTIDYSAVLQVIQQEFATPSRLLEHLACRISKSLLANFAMAQQVDICVKKIAPPMPGNVRSAAVRLSFTRE
ncbi:MAG: dihydroneopterin aldolase [Bacteroidaceae bacterium]|nr:dihydroneopterin aldolase [Bacteroidaceae bacterium]